MYAFFLATTFAMVSYIAMRMQTYGKASMCCTQKYKENMHHEKIKSRFQIFVSC